MSNLKSRHLLNGLGKPTLRGIRKCPKCGTYNGTRGNTCKNKDCNHTFKPSVKVVNRLSAVESISKNGLDSVKLITGFSTSNIYSVRVRCRGPDYRGFVEVPIIQGLDERTDPSLDASFIAATTARCFIESCRKVSLPLESNTTQNLTTASKTSSSANGRFESNVSFTIIQSCSHIKESVKCEKEAICLPLENLEIILNTLEATEEIKNEICYLVNETVNGSSLVQRVSKSSFMVKCKPSNRHQLGYLHCSFSENYSNNSPPNTSAPTHRFSCTCRSFKNSNSDEKNELTTIKFQTTSSMVKKCAHYYACICCFASDANLINEFRYYLQMELPAIIAQTEITITGSLPPKKLKIDEPNINSKKLINSGLLSETQISCSFIDWLSSVTELINSTQHYQLSSKPDPLVFRIPFIYFDCLQQRIASGLRKKRLPNMTTVFTRKDSAPIGTFTKYTYFITNLQQVKKIFDTPQVSLQITQSFIQNRNGNFDFLKINNEKKETNLQNYPNINSHENIHIRPSELKTCLKVGLMFQDQKESAPFIIEWIPNVLPETRVGELRIQFQFIHLKNGKLDLRD